MPAPTPPVGQTRPLVLDTDIGTDVDDAMALGVLLGSPEVDLIGVSTVYGDTALRAQLAQRLLRLGGRGDCPVAPGARHTLSGKEPRWAGWEGQAQPDLDSETVEADADGVDMLVNAAAEHSGELEVAAIGPLTNIALAIDRDPAFATNVARLHIMGGALDGRMAEWNFACDTTAADVVLRSGIPTILTDLRICQRTRFEATHLQLVEAAASPLATALSAEIRAYWRSRDHEWNTPHDPVALLPLLAPDTVQVEARQVQCDPATGVTRLGEDSGEAIDVATDLDPREVVDEIVRRLVVATT